ncbi:MAG: hypothetical protein ACI8UR_001426 [Natronomonas sp.]
MACQAVTRIRWIKSECHRSPMYARPAFLRGDNVDIIRYGLLADER